MSFGDRPQDEGKAINESIKDIDFSEEQWQEVDQKLFVGIPLLALRAVLEFGKPSLRLLDAQELMFERYAKLRAERPAQAIYEAILVEEYSFHVCPEQPPMCRYFSIGIDRDENLCHTLADRFAARAAKRREPLGGGPLLVTGP